MEDLIMVEPMKGNFMDNLINVEPMKEDIVDEDPTGKHCEDVMFRKDWKECVHKAPQDQ